MRQDRVLMGMLVGGMFAFAGGSANAGTWFGPLSGHIEAPAPHVAPVEVAKAFHGMRSDSPFVALVGLVRSGVSVTGNEAVLDGSMGDSLPLFQTLHTHIGGLGAMHVNREGHGPGLLRPQPSNPRPLPDLNEVPTVPGATNDAISIDELAPNLGTPASDHAVERAVPIIPLPSAAGIGFLGLGALAARRRR